MRNINVNVVLLPDAVANLKHGIGWGDYDYKDNRVEQGGILVGRYVYNTESKLCVEVHDILMAKASKHSSGYIEWSAMEEIRLMRLFYEIQDNLEVTNPSLSKELTIVGWWHTHPNSLDVFMSSTDMATQRLKYNDPRKISIVLNPHRQIFKAFVGGDAAEVDVKFLDAVPETTLIESKKNSRNDRKRKNRKRRKRRLRRRK